MHKKTVLVSLAALLMAACGNTKKSTVETAGAMLPVGPAFVADSAYAFCQQQCDFGPRTMNSEAHDRCGEWIAQKFRDYGMEVTLQQAALIRYDFRIKEGFSQSIAECIV